MRDDSFRDRWAEDYDGDQFTGRYECRRCGASVRPQNTELHDGFHAQIDALVAQPEREERKL